MFSETYFGATLVFRLPDKLRILLVLKVGTHLALSKVNKLIGVR